MIVKLLTGHHLEFLSLKGGCSGSSESTLVKMSNCRKSHAAAHMVITHVSFYTVKIIYCSCTFILRTFCHVLSFTFRRTYLGLVARKPVFGVSEKASFKPVSSAAETS